MQAATFPLKSSGPTAASSPTYFAGSLSKCHPSHPGLTHDGHIVLDLEECLLAALPQDVEGVRQKLLFFFFLLQNYVFIYVCVYIYAN